MPKKRPVEVRIAELEDKLERLKLEKQIADLQAQLERQKPTDCATGAGTARIPVWIAPDSTVSGISDRGRMVSPFPWWILLPIFFGSLSKTATTSKPRREKPR